MLHSTVTASAKRAAFRAKLASGELIRMPGAFNPLSALLIQDRGFEGVYISGAVLSADLGLPDIGLTTLTEVAVRGAQIARVTDLPTLIDAMPALVALGGATLLSEPLTLRLVVASAALLGGIALVLKRRVDGVGR